MAQQNAEEARDNQGALYDEKAIPRIQARLRQAGYEAHGWHQAFAAGKEEPAALVAWIKKESPDAFKSLIDPDYQELGIGISEIRGTPLYDFFLAWRESESFARQTGSPRRPRPGPRRHARPGQRRAGRGRPAAAQARSAPERGGPAPRRGHAAALLLQPLLAGGDHPRRPRAQERLRPRIVAENIARGPFTVDEAIDNWMLSREHRSNLLHPAFRDFGAGIAVGRNSVGYTVIWVQDFGTP